VLYGLAENPSNREVVGHFGEQLLYVHIATVRGTSEGRNADSPTRVRSEDATQGSGQQPAHGQLDSAELGESFEPADQ
jgi:hypothetical protein